MAVIPPIEDAYINDVIKSNEPYDPNSNLTQGEKVRELLKLMRDRLEQEISSNKTSLVSKVDKIQGKGLSTNDYSNIEKSKVSNLELQMPGKADKTYVDDQLEPVYQRLLELERMLAPFKPTSSGANHARVWWTSDQPIPAGWQEDTAMRGLFPLHWNPTVARYSVKGDWGGSDEVKLETTHLPRFHVKLFANATRDAQGSSDISDQSYVVKGTTGSGTRDEKYALLSSGGTATLGKSSEVGQDQKHDNMPPYRIGVWIKYVGV